MDTEQCAGQTRPNQPELLPATTNRKTSPNQGGISLSMKQNTSFNVVNHIYIQVSTNLDTKQIYTQKILHKENFYTEQFCTQEHLHRETVTPGILQADLSHKTVSTHRNLLIRHGCFYIQQIYTEKSLHTELCTDGDFTHRSFYTGHFTPDVSNTQML